MNFYDRTLTSNSDGTPLRCHDADIRAERSCAELIESAWNCTLMPFGRLCPIDWYCLRDGRLIGVAELKTRTHQVGKYPTVFLNVRKWLALSMADVGLCVPAVFVVQFTDAVRWVRVPAIDASKVRMGGCNQRHSSHTDIEPVIEVPIEQMKPLVKE